MWEGGRILPVAHLVVSLFVKRSDNRKLIFFWLFFWATVADVWLIPGGIDKDLKPRISYLKPGGIAARYAAISYVAVALYQTT